MKYQDGKLKREHHVLSEFEGFLRMLTKLPEVKRLIPGRIARQQKGTSQQSVSVSYETGSGLKCKLKKGATVQELFIICDTPDRIYIREWIQNHELFL